MALGQQQEKRIYLSVNDGLITMGTGAERKYFLFLEGTIEAIYKKVSYFGGEAVPRWYIDIRDEKLYTLCLPFSSGVFKSIILSLANYTSLSRETRIKIEPYKSRKGFTNAAVYADGEKLSWMVKTIPPLEEVSIGGKIVKDNTKQMEYITQFVRGIQEKINA